MSRWRAMGLGSRFFLAASLLVLGRTPLSAASLDDRLEAGWRVQRRWAAISANGSFIYEFALKTWNAAGRLKEDFTRSARVVNRGEEHRTEILAATKDGRDDIAGAKAEEEKRARAPESKKKNDFPSPFDPQFRERYQFLEEPAENELAVISFHPRAPFDGALAGRAFYDAEGRFRRVNFTLAKRPTFTRRIDFTILVGADGLPERVEVSGEVSLVVWKRRFESTLALKDIQAGLSEEAR